MSDHSPDRSESLRPFIEEALRRALALDPAAQIAALAPARLGLNSLGAIALQYQLQERFGADLTIGEILGAESIDGLAALARSRRPDQGTAGDGAADAYSPLAHDGVLI